MGELNILFLRGTYLTKIDQLKKLLNDVSVTNSDDFRDELLSAFRDGVLASWCKKRGLALTGIDLSADKPLYEAIVKRITGKTDFKATDKAFIGNFAEPLKDDDVKFDDDTHTLKITIRPIKPTNDKFRFDLKNKEGKKISKSQELDWKDKTKNTVVSLVFDLKGYDEREFELWLNGSEKLKTIESVYSFTVNGVTFNMILVEHGTFKMGATPEMKDPSADEKPVHQVTLTKDYYLGETQVTQDLWYAVMGNNPSAFKGSNNPGVLNTWLTSIYGNNPSAFKGSNNPVESVSWNDCQEFIKKLNVLTGKNFRLPTEAEWEFAARGGNKSNHTQYAGGNYIRDVAWSSSNSRNKTHPVAQLKSNELDLYDMTGNVCEWCNDRYAKYPDSSVIDPQGATGDYRVTRGGCWRFSADGCRLSYRCYRSQNSRDNEVGFRLAL